MTPLEVYIMLTAIYNQPTSSEPLNEAVLDALDAAWVELTDEQKEMLNDGKPFFDLDDSENAVQE